MVAQGLAVAIFVAMFVLIVMDKFGRQYITLGCGALTLIGVFGICMRSVNAIWEIINLRSIFTPDSIKNDTIISTLSAFFKLLIS